MAGKFTRHVYVTATCALHPGSSPLIPAPSSQPARSGRASAACPRPRARNRPPLRTDRSLALHQRSRNGVALKELVRAAASGARAAQTASPRRGWLATDHIIDSSCSFRNREPSV